jgi:hypothetical protein
MLRSPDAVGTTKHLGRSIPYHTIPIKSGFAEFILSLDHIGAEGLRMTSHAPSKRLTAATEIYRRSGC